MMRNIWFFVSKEKFIYNQLKMERFKQLIKRKKDRKIKHTVVNIKISRSIRLRHGYGACDRCVYFCMIIYKSVHFIVMYFYF